MKKFAKKDVGFKSKGDHVKPIGVVPEPMLTKIG